MNVLRTLPLRLHRVCPIVCVPIGFVDPGMAERNERCLGAVTP